MSDHFWHGRTVLVTGGGGFIGSHLVEHLSSLGAGVRVVCRYNSRGLAGWLDECAPSARAALDVRFGDVRDARWVEAACGGVDTVFHLAALIGIPYSYEAPRSYVDTNIVGTLNVLEAVRQAGCRRMVNVSTSEVYGTPDAIPIVESHALRGQSPYSASKISAEQLCVAYHRAYGVGVVTVRPFNTYGPRQSGRAVLPSMLGQLLAGATAVRLGRLDPLRDLTFVSDTVAGLVSAGSADGVEGEVVQLGTGHAVSIGDLFDLACRVLGRRATVIQDDARLRPAASEVEALLSDPAKARALLGWRAAVSLEEGIVLTAQWMEGHRECYDAGRYDV